MPYQPLCLQMLDSSKTIQLYVYIWAVVGSNLLLTLPNLRDSVSAAAVKVTGLFLLLLPRDFFLNYSAMPLSLLT